MRIYSGKLYINGKPWPVQLDGGSMSALRKDVKNYAKEYCGAKSGDRVEIRNIWMTQEIVKRFKRIKVVI